jgi:prepilin-type N-terminal cleavage/methylation domain-containing protein
VVSGSRQRTAAAGFTLIEVVVSLAVFGIFILILVTMTAEMHDYERRYPVNFLAHPQVSSALGRIRRDVFSATDPYYPDSFYDPATKINYTQGKTTLILTVLQESGFTQTVVWDFSAKGEAWRRAYSGTLTSSLWVARGMPSIELTDFPIDAHHPDSVRIKAVDDRGTLAIDQVYQPRHH